jgi:Flp pilus assembly protein CpaB
VTRSSRLLTAGVIAIAVGLIVAFFALRDGTEPISVNDAAATATADTASPGDGVPDESSSERGIGEVLDDEERLPIPLVIPQGQEAVAISAAYANGVAAIPAPGDRVNVYAVFTDGVPAQLQSSSTSSDSGQPAGPQDNKGVIRLLSHVEVLGVSGVQAVAGGGAVTLVLAVAPADAERLIYQAATQSIWFSLVNEADDEVDGAGVLHDTLLDTIR